MLRLVRLAGDLVPRRLQLRKHRCGPHESLLRFPRSFHVIQDRLARRLQLRNAGNSVVYTERVGRCAADDGDRRHDEHQRETAAVVLHRRSQLVWCERYWYNNLQ